MGDWDWKTLWRRVLLLLAIAAGLGAGAAVESDPAVLNGHDGGLWLFDAPELPPLMLTINLSEQPDPARKQAFWEGIRTAAEKGEPSRVIWLLRFSRAPGETEKLPSFKSARRQLDAWFGDADGIATDPQLLLGVVPEEENTQTELLECIGAYLRDTYRVKCYQWLTEPWPPTLALQADGWVFDAYSDNDEQFFARIEKFILYGKPVVPILWGSADWGGSWGFYVGKPIQEQLAILMRRMDWCRSFNLPVIVFAVSGELGSINQWYYGGVESGKSEAFVEYRDAIAEYLKAMPDTPLPPIRPVEKRLPLTVTRDRGVELVVNGNDFAMADRTNFDDARHWQVTTAGLKLLAPAGELYWLPVPSGKLEELHLTIAYQAETDAMLALEGFGEMQLPAGSHELSGVLDCLAGGRLTLRCKGTFLLKQLKFTGRGDWRTAPLVLRRDGDRAFSPHDGFADGVFAASLKSGDWPPELNIGDKGVTLRGAAGYATQAVLVQQVALPPGAKKIRVRAEVAADAPNYGSSLTLIGRCGTTERKIAADPARVRQTLALEIVPLPGTAEMELVWDLRVGCGVATPNAAPVGIFNYQIEVEL